MGNCPPAPVIRRKLDLMQHFHHHIGGWAAFSQLYIDAVKHFPSGSRFVEVGSWLGKSAALMGVEIENSAKQIEFVCVDPWIDGGPDLRDTKYFKELHVPQVYDLFLLNVRPVLHRIKTMRMPSVEAARFMADETVDFIMLDGDHSYDAVKADISAWLPKMKKGGIMSGDDYTWPGVETAVREAFGARANAIFKSRRSSDYKKDSSFWMVTL